MNACLLSEYVSLTRVPPSPTSTTIAERHTYGLLIITHIQSYYLPTRLSSTSARDTRGGYTGVYTLLLKEWLNFSRKLHTSFALRKLHATILVLSGSQSENSGTTKISLHPVRSSSRQDYVTLVPVSLHRTGAC